MCKFYNMRSNLTSVSHIRCTAMHIPFHCSRAQHRKFSKTFILRHFLPKSVIISSIYFITCSPDRHALPQPHSRLTPVSHAAKQKKKMKVVKGDLVALARAGDFDVIVHGCNCFCRMGAGIALAIKTVFPEAYKADLSTKIGSRHKLGTYTCARIDSDGHELVVVNGYTQFHYGRRGIVHVDYSAVESVFAKVKEDFSGKRIGYPKIGAGLAGGDWNRISKIIDQELDGEDHTLVEWDKGRL